MHNMARLERLKRELRSREPEEGPCIVHYDPENPKRDLYIKRHLEKCKKTKKRHYFFPIIKGQLQLPKVDLKMKKENLRETGS